MKLPSKSSLLLLAILLLAAGLRLYGLENQSLWNDELSSWYRSHFDTLHQVIHEGVVTDVHPPGFQIFLYGVIHYLADTAWWLRLPSAIAGVASVWVIYLWGQRLYGTEEGLVAAALMAVLWAPVYYSQEARAYSLLLLTSSLSLYVWLDLVLAWRAGSAGNWWRWLLYWQLTVLTAYLHYFGLLFVALQVAVAFGVVNWRYWRWPVVLFGLVGLAYLPWLPYMVQQFGRGPTWIETPTLTAVSEYARFSFGYFDRLLWLVSGLYVWLALQTIRQPSERIRTLFLAGWLLLPFVVAYGFSVWAMPVLTSRNLIVLLPAAYLLLARALTRLPLPPGLRVGVHLGVALLALVNLISWQNYYSSAHKDQVREVAAYMTDHDASDQAAIIAFTWRNVYLDYYLERWGSPLRVSLVAGEPEDMGEVEDWLAAQRQPYIWFVTIHREPNLDFVAFLNARLIPVEHMDFYRVSAWLYKQSE